MTKYFLAEGAKSAGTVSIQRRDAQGAWRNYRGFDVPRGSRYDVWVESNLVWIAVRGAEPVGDWDVQPLGADLGHWIGVSKGSSVYSHEPILGAVMTRKDADGNFALAILGLRQPEPETEEPDEDA